jgi:hypothetical protein
VVELRAHVTEWNGPERVSFELTGLNEEVEGGGSLVMVPDVAPASTPPPKGWLRRLFDSLFRVLLRPIFGDKPAREALPAARAASRLSFTLRMEAGGVTGPLVNAMLGPAIELAAEDLARKIAAHLEALHGRKAAAR